MVLEFGVMENHIEIVKEPEKISHKKDSANLQWC